MREEQRLIQIMAEQFNLSEADLARQKTLDSLALDSLELMELSVTIEEEFDIQLDDVDFQQLRTLGQMADVILEKIKDE